VNAISWGELQVIITGTVNTSQCTHTQSPTAQTTSAIVLYNVCGKAASLVWDMPFGLLCSKWELDEPY